MIQDIEPKRFFNQYTEKNPSEYSRIVSFSDGKILYREQDGKMEFPTFAQVKQHLIQKNVKWTGREDDSRIFPEAVYLFTIEQEDFFLMDLQNEIFEDFSYHKMFETRHMHPKEYVLAAATGWHLYVWYRDNQFCGRCAKKLVHDEKLRMMKCTSCGNMVFPKIAPAVIVGVINGDKILMTKYAGREYKKYALIAGFTEIGETAEQTVEREVMEEVGLHVKNIRYYKSQPWGYDSDLLIGYFCELAEEHEIELDETELSLAEWVDYKDVPDDPEGLSLTREMMLTFREKKKREHGELS